MEHILSRPPRVLRHLGTLTACFAVVLILSNIISAKLMNLFGYPLDCGIMIFPLSYIIGDVLAEVYGFKESRRVVWTGFALQLFAIITIKLATIATPATGWPYQVAFEQIFGLVPRISLASLVAYLFGEFTNGWALVWIKKKTGGHGRSLRFIGSTIIGEAVDTTLFLIIAFAGVWPAEQLVAVWFTNYIFKVAFEIPMLPITYVVASWLKRAEDLADNEQKNTWFALFKKQQESVS